MSCSSCNTHDNRQMVLVVGSTGLIGSHVVELLSSPEHARRYAVAGVTRDTTPGLNLEDPESISTFFRLSPDFHHVIVAAGDARFGTLDTLDTEAFEVGLRSKLMGQVHIAVEALRRLSPGGSVTLTSGELSHQALPGTAAVALVNGAIDSFVRASSLDIPADRRINVVSPGWIKETMMRMGMDPSPGVSAADVARLYLKAMEGNATGVVIRAELQRPQGLPRSA